MLERQTRTKSMNPYHTNHISDVEWVEEINFNNIFLSHLIGDIKRNWVSVSRKIFQNKGGGAEKDFNYGANLVHNMLLQHCHLMVEHKNSQKRILLKYYKISTSLKTGMGMIRFTKTWTINTQQHCSHPQPFLLVSTDHDLRWTPP